MLHHDDDKAVNTEDNPDNVVPGSGPGGILENGKAQIRRKDCIKCFCCQEFCPKGAMKVHRTAIARLLNK